MSEYNSSAGTASFSKANFAVDSSNPNLGGSNAGSTNSSSFIQAEIQKEINDPTTPIYGPGSGSSITASPIYVVITDPNFAGSNGGYNAPGTYKDSSGNAIPINMVSVGSGSNNLKDGVTLTLSHELAERITDPTGNGNGVTISYPTGTPNWITGGFGSVQIGDGEAEPVNQPHYAYRIGGAGGVLVQPYWSQKALGGQGAFIYSDGAPNHEYDLTPSWSGLTNATPTFNNTYTLSISPEAGANVTVRTDTLGDVIINWDGQVETFAGNGTPITGINIDSSKAAAAGGKINLTIDASAPVPIGATFNLDEYFIPVTFGVLVRESLDGLLPGGITYDNYVNATINVGAFGTLNVNSTNEQSTIINTKRGAVYVNDTAADVWVNATGGSSVTVGDGSSLPAGTSGLAGLSGRVYVYSTDNSAQLYIDDSSDTTTHSSAELGSALFPGNLYFPGWQELTGLSTYGVYYQANEVTPSIALGANTTLAVQSTGTRATEINTNGDGDNINVQSISSNLTIDSSGAGTETIGASVNSLDYIGGQITINGSGSDTLAIDDANGSGGVTAPTDATNIS